MPTSPPRAQLPGGRGTAVRPPDELPEDELPEDELPEDELPEDELPPPPLLAPLLLDGALYPPDALAPADDGARSRV